jgi:CRP-like cAMP-binding protein
MDTAPPPSVNRILASADADAYAELLSHLELIHLQSGDVLYDAVGAVNYVHFPTTALISAFLDTATGACGEVALIGNEGVVGAMAMLTGMRVPFRGAIDSSGHAFRIKPAILQQQLKAGSSMHRAMMRYLTTRMIQMATNSVCNLHHSLEQRLCRAVLMRLERAGGDSLFMTHESMANILGVRRPGVTQVAAELKRAGAITYSRGRVFILNRSKLESCACECYEAMKTQTARVESAL